MLTFFLTTKCNLECVYCYTEQLRKTDQSLPFEFARLAVDDYIGKGDVRHLRFYGAGEPTQEFELMCRILDHAKSVTDDPLTIEIQTNGFFGNNVREWIAENVDICWLSWDGTPEIHNKLRCGKYGKPSADVLEKTARYLLENGKGMTGARMTICKENADKQREAVDYFASFGIDKIWSAPLYNAIGKNHEIQPADLMEYAKSFLAVKDHAAKQGVFYGSFLTCNFDEKIKYNCRACLPMPHLTTDGYISACDTALFGEDDSPLSVFIYGKWDREKNIITYDQSKMDQLKSRHADNMDKCKGCEALYNCAGWCLGEVVNETGDLFGIKENICEPLRYLYQNIKAKEHQYDFTHP